jgi:hypothetical protein
MGAIALALASTLGLAGQAYAVDGVIEINQARALAGGVTPGDTAGFPVTISVSGSYRLTGNLDAVGTDPPAGGIFVNTGNVTVDLNGFTVSNVTQGVSTTVVDNVTVRNGTISNASNWGINLDGTLGRVERMRVLSAGGTASPAIDVGDDCYVTESTVADAVHTGINVGNGCTVSRNVVRGTTTGALGTGDGIVTDSGCTIVENTVIDSSGNGIETAGGLVSRNTVTGNGENGIFVIGEGDFHSAAVVGNVLANNVSLGLSRGSNTSVAVGHNVIWGNNGGNANQQTSAILEIDANQCGTNTTCP